MRIRVGKVEVCLFIGRKGVLENIIKKAVELQFNRALGNALKEHRKLRMP